MAHTREEGGGNRTTRLRHTGCTRKRAVHRTQENMPTARRRSASPSRRTEGGKQGGRPVCAEVERGQRAPAHVQIHTHVHGARGQAATHTRPILLQCVHVRSTVHHQTQTRTCVCVRVWVKCKRVMTDNPLSGAALSRQRRRHTARTITGDTLQYSTKQQTAAMAGGGTHTRLHGAPGRGKVIELQ